MSTESNVVNFKSCCAGGDDLCTTTLTEVEVYLQNS